MNEDLIRRVMALETEVERLRTLETGDRSGASFPASPSAGDPPWFRTDRGLWYYYDGTQWLTTNEYETSFLPWEAAPPYSTSSFQILTPPRNDYNLYLVRATAITDVLGVNNINNYWTISLRTEVATLWTFNTQNDGGSNTYRTQVLNTVYVPSATPFFRLRLDSATGSPGGVRMSSAIWYRLIG